MSNNDNDGVSFVDRNVFQDGDLVPTNTALTAAEGSESGAPEHLWTNAAGAGATLAGACNAGPALNNYHTLLLKGLPEDALPLIRHGWYRD